MKKIDWLIILFIIFASIYTLKDLFTPGFYTSHDGIHQVVRLYYFDQAVRDGQIPPRFAGGLLNGFGYPLFIFSYHLPWIIAEPLYFSGLSIFDSIKMTFLIGYTLSGITMYIFQKELFGKLPAFVGSMVYLFAPYRFSNIFVRAAIGDATTFIFPPLVFLALNKLSKVGSSYSFWVAVASLSLASILLSHAMVFLFFFLSIILYMIYRLLFLKKRRNFILANLSISILSFGLASYYFVPSLVEKSWTKFSEIIKSVYFESSFISLYKLIYSPWGYGTIDAKEGAMSLQIGIAQWIGVGLSATLIILYLTKRLRISKGSFLNNLYDFLGVRPFVAHLQMKTCINYFGVRPNLNNLREGVFFLIIFILSIFLMLPDSKSFWMILSKFVIIDFPWRILALTTFSASVLTGFVVSRVKFRYFFAILIIILAIYGNRNHLRINKTLDWTLPFYLLLEKTTNSYGEYTPKWVKNEIVEKPRSKVEPSDKDAEVKISKNKSNLLEFTISTNQEGLVRLNTIYYPGWEVYINDREINISYDSGLIEFFIDRGESSVVTKFTETPLRKISNIISLSSLVIIFLIFISPVKRRIFNFKKSKSIR